MSLQRRNSPRRWATTGCSCPLTRRFSRRPSSHTAFRVILSAPNSLASARLSPACQDSVPKLAPLPTNRDPGGHPRLSQGLGGVFGVMRKPEMRSTSSAMAESSGQHFAISFGSSSTIRAPAAPPLACKETLP
eukprot:scaffold136_cov325-Pavlova_lutheri.AAC.10